MRSYSIAKIDFQGRHGLLLGQCLNEGLSVIKLRKISLS